ncbi:hypothetical protein Tco_0490836 [Tanacetum coccineum]
MSSGKYLKQSTAEPTNIPKAYTQAASSKVPTASNYASHSDEIICSFFSQQASMPTTHDDEDLLQIDEDAMEEIDIRWQVAMITARIRKFMRKDRETIDLKTKNGIDFCIQRVECFNCRSKVGSLLRSLGGNSTTMKLFDGPYGEILCASFGRKMDYGVIFDLEQPKLMNCTSISSFMAANSEEPSPKETFIPSAEYLQGDGLISSYSPSSRSSTTRAPHRPQRPKKIVKSIWIKKGSTVGSQAVLPQSVKRDAMIRQSGRGSKDYDIIDSGIAWKYDGDKANFKFVDEDLVILRAPRKNDVYSLDLKNIIPSGGITCLVAKATE